MPQNKLFPAPDRLSLVREEKWSWQPLKEFRMKLFLSAVLIFSLVFNPALLLAEESTSTGDSLDLGDPFASDLFSDTPSTDSASLPSSASADTAVAETEKPAAEAKKKVTKKKKKAAKKVKKAKKTKKAAKAKKAVKKAKAKKTAA